MSWPAQPRRAVTFLAIPSILVLMLGSGCLPDAPESVPPPTPISASIVSDYSWDTGQTGTAAAVVEGSTGSVAYRWSITAPGVIVGSANDLVVSFTSSTASAATLILTATDSGTGTSDTVAFEVEFYGVAAGQSLVVDAGPDQTVAVGYTVLLLGSASGAVGSLDFQWRQASGPAQDTAPEYANGSPAITVIGKTPGTAVFELIVRDYTANVTVTKTVTVVVTAPPN